MAKKAGGLGKSFWDVMEDNDFTSKEGFALLEAEYYAFKRFYDAQWKLAKARIRREKLAKLVSEGKNPYEQVKYPVDADSASIKADYEKFEGKTVTLPIDEEAFEKHLDELRANEHAANKKATAHESDESCSERWKVRW